jgi:thiol peroxidase
MKRNEGIITFGGNPLTISGNMIEVGVQAPDFTALNNDLVPVKLSNFDGKIRIISSMPSIDTSVCAAQTRKFNVEATNHENVVVLTISMDLPFALKRFCGAEGIEKAITLSDSKGREFAEKYGFMIEELGLLARGVVVVDQNGKVVHVEYVSEVTNEPNYEKALQAVKNLQ